MQNRAATVRKADGSIEPFSEEKLRSSLRRAGASEDTTERIVTHIEAELSDGMTTGDIYRHARALLKTAHTPAAARYSLRRALFNLGPTGFPFETFLAALFQTQGYETQTGITLRGRCVAHEVDLVAYKADHCFIAEAKFHAYPGAKSDLQVALYSYARFEDLKGLPFPGKKSCTIVDSYIITNTKFTSVAIDYASCVGIKLLSWNYPKERTLQHVIETAGVYPITALTGISEKSKRLLLSHGIVLCKDMAGKRDILRSLGFSSHKVEAMITESVNLCTSA